MSVVLSVRIPELFPAGDAHPLHLSISGFWYAQPLVVTAARDAFLTKRVGDVLLLMGVVALCSYSGAMGFNDLYAWASRLPFSLAATLLGLRLIGDQRVSVPSSRCTSGWMRRWRAPIQLPFCTTRRRHLRGDCPAQSDADPAALHC